MREVLNTTLGFLFIWFLYGLQQFAKRLGISGPSVEPKYPPAPGPTGDCSSITRYLYQATRRLFERLGDPAALLFLAFDEGQSKLLQLVLGAFSTERDLWSLTPRRVMDQCALAWAGIGLERAISIQQIRNTRYIFVLVRNNLEILRIPRTGLFDLIEFIDKAYGIGEFENIWAVEGLGHVYAQRTWLINWSASDNATGILWDGQAALLPEQSLTMMHAGLGLCFAESLLKRLSPASSQLDVKFTVDTFIRLCRSNSRPGYIGCALESLGLVTRCFNYRLVYRIHAVLAEMDMLAWEFFWRGVGRAMYFSPLHLLQPLASPWIAAEREAPNNRVLQILRGGISWPTHIVNMKNPLILESFIQRFGVSTESCACIAQGVAASTTMTLDITPNHSLVWKLLEYEPKTSEQTLWTRLVREPVRKSIDRYHPLLKRHRMMDQVFRFQDLDSLLDGLEADLP